MISSLLNESLSILYMLGVVDFWFFCCAIVGFATVRQFYLFEAHFRLVAHLSGHRTCNSATNLSKTSLQIRFRDLKFE